MKTWRPGEARPVDAFLPNTEWPIWQFATATSDDSEKWQMKERRRRQRRQTGRLYLTPSPFRATEPFPLNFPPLMVLCCSAALPAPMLSSKKRQYVVVAVLLLVLLFFACQFEWSSKKEGRSTKSETFSLFVCVVCGRKCHPLEKKKRILCTKRAFGFGVVLCQSSSASALAEQDRTERSGKKAHHMSKLLLLAGIIKLA